MRRNTLDRTLTIKQHFFLKLLEEFQKSLAFNKLRHTFMCRLTNLFYLTSFYIRILKLKA